MIRIYTEDLNRSGIVQLLDSLFDGYTIVPTLGRWKGQDEPSLMIEFAGAPRSAVDNAALAIKSLNHQQAVMVAEDSHETTTFL